MIWAFAIIFFLYFICIIRLLFAFKKVPLFATLALQPKIFFSVIIPFRNESENLPNLLKSIENLNYPSQMFEIIFVNDASEDTSEEIITAAIEKSKFAIKLLQNNRISNSPKKDAISEGIKNSSFGWIVTTDADCELPKNWLKSLDSFIQKNNPLMICGPVIYKSNGSFIENFQQLDGLSLQSVTIGSFGLRNPFLCNGANLAYKKEAFLKVNGFSGNDHIASGDDIFLLEKMKKAFPGQVQFLKSEEAIVATKTQKNWKSAINQRVRWASKTSKQANPYSLILGMIVFLVNISVLVFPFFLVFDFENSPFFILLIFLKLIIDFIAVRQAAHFFEIKIKFWRFLWHPFLYAVLILVIVIKSLGGNYTWKGRTFKKQ